MKNKHFMKHFKRAAALLLSMTLISMTAVVALADETDPAETTASVESSETETEKVDLEKVKEDYLQMLSERTGEGYLSIQGYVEDEIRNQGYNCYVQVQNVVTGNCYDIYLYATNNYAATTTLPAGGYSFRHATVVNDTTSKYPSTIKDDPTVWIIEDRVSYAFDIFDGTVYTIEIAFGDASFDNIVSETEAVSSPIIEIETEEPEAESIEETVEKGEVESAKESIVVAAEIAETVANEAEETQAKGGSTKVVIGAIFLVVVVVACVCFKAKNKKGQQ